ncbi:hypothetical protein L3Q67_25885 [Saccharothrix sp. AJ9571]|nr:hypothetical protein L3Q67_25885 [Saccharothrix sp. AJ9571]
MFTKDPVALNGPRAQCRCSLGARLADAGLSAAVLQAVLAAPPDSYAEVAEYLADDPGAGGGHRWWLDGLFPVERLALEQDRDGLEPSLLTIACTLHYLDVHDGQTVLELAGTAGVTTALLERLTSFGTVLTVGGDPGRRHEGPTTAPKAADLAAAPDFALEHYRGPVVDRIVCWREPERIPRGWVDHLEPGGRIVTVYGGVITVLTADNGHGHATFHRSATVTLPPAHTAVGGAVWRAVTHAPLEEPSLRLTQRCLVPTDATATWAQIQDATRVWHKRGKPTPEDLAARFDPVDPLLRLYHEDRELIGLSGDRGHR